MADDDVADLLDEALETAKKDAPAEPKPNEPKDSNKEKEEKDRSRSKRRSRSRSRDRRSGSRDRFGRMKRKREKSRERGSRSRDRRDKGRRSRSRRSRRSRRRSRNRGGRRRRTSSSRAKRRVRDRDRDREREKERGGKKEGSSSPSRRPQRSAISPESMPKLAEPPISPKDPPPPGSAPEEGDDKKKKKSKWDEMGDPSALPDWLKDLKEDGRPTPPGIDPARFKIIRMEGVQIRALIGKGGETIKDIRLRSGADIKIDHLPSDPEGNVTIVGDVDKTEVMIKEALATKGCPLVPKPQVPPPPPDGMPGMHGVGGMPPPLEPNENEVIVPGDIVGHLIGPSGATMKEIREQAGGQVFISILPPSSPGADQIVRVVGDNREYARQLILEKIEDLKVQYRSPGGVPVQPGFPGGMGMPGIGAPMGGAAPHVPGKSKATFPQPPMPMLQPSALPVPSMPLRPAPAALPYGGAGSSFVPRPGVMTQPGCGCGCGGCGCGCGCGGCGYGGGPEMDPRPSLGGCGLPAMGSTTGPNPGYMGGCGMGGLGMAQMPPPGMGPPAMGMGMAGAPPGAPGCGVRAPPAPPPGPPGLPPGPPGLPPGPPGPPGLGGLGSCHLGLGPAPPAHPAPQANFPPPAPPMAPVTAVSPPSLGSIQPPIPAAEPPGDPEKQDFNAMLREAAKAAEATIGMSNTPKPFTPSAGVPLL